MVPPVSAVNCRPVVAPHFKKRRSPSFEFVAVKKAVAEISLASQMVRHAVFAGEQYIEIN